MAQLAFNLGAARLQKKTKSSFAFTEKSEFQFRQKLANPDLFWIIAVLLLVTANLSEVQDRHTGCRNRNPEHISCLLCKKKWLLGSKLQTHGRSPAE